MQLADLAKLIDVSAVRCDSTMAEIDQMCEAAKRYDVIGVFTMPWCVSHVAELLKDTPEIHIGSVSGFPSGGDSTDTKLSVINDLIHKRVVEIDTVLNVSALKSGCISYVQDELKRIRAATQGRIMKIIIEAPLLTDEEAILATTLVAASGADFVKTGTGWHGATPIERIRLICETANGKCGVKAAGGIRSFETVMGLYNLGVKRFGVGMRTLDSIMKEMISGCD